MTDAEGTTPLAEVLVVVDAVRALGCRFWLEGGWGVDALVGHQTRPHRDVDLDVDEAFEAHVLSALAALGYVIETDWRPNRVELVRPGRGRVDVHPLVIDDEGAPAGPVVASPDHSARRVADVMGQKQGDGAGSATSGQAEARVRQAALGGGWHEYPRGFAAVGRLGDVEVPCVSAATQRFFRTGYEPREVDRLDLATLDGLETV